MQGSAGSFGADRLGVISTCRSGSLLLLRLLNNLGARHGRMFPFILVDLLVGAGALTSGLFWWMASRHRLRRLSRLEDLDAGDINRIVTVLNRTQILNARAALTASVTAALAGVNVILQTLLSG